MASFAQSLPRLPSELDVIVVRKEGANQSHRDFRVRRAVVHRALQWLVTHNQYYHSLGVTIDITALDQLPQNGNISQQAFSEVKYLIIDEMSMVGRKIFGQVDRRLRQAFPHHSQEVFGGCSCLLFGDFGQLPPVMDLPLYTTDSRSELSDQGRAAYQTFQQAVVLDQVMRQAGQDPEQVKFRDILLRLRDATVTSPTGTI